MRNCRASWDCMRVVLLAGLVVACGDDDDGVSPDEVQMPVATPVAGSSGVPGSAGSNSGSAGSAAAAGAGAGAATAGTGATAGNGGASGQAGAAGTIAASGSGGTSGAAGAAGTTVDDIDDVDDPGDHGDDDAGSDPDDSVDEDPDGDPAWPPPPASDELAELPEQLAMGLCEALASCLGTTLSELAFDGAACVPRTIAELEDGDFVFMQASIDAGRLRFDPTALGQCVDDYGALGCGLLAARPPASCESALHGQVALGGACVIDDDCAGTAFCDRSAACPGACTALLAAGGDCDRNDQCQGGLQCLAGKCGRAALATEACEGGAAPECELGLVCIGQDSATNRAGSCRTQASLLVKAAGEPCDVNGGTWCQPGLACVVDVLNDNGTPTLTQVCRARVASGQECHTSLVPQQCPAGEYCPADLDPEYTANCAPRPGLDQPCGVFNTCAPDLTCDGTRCRATRRRIGSACRDDGDCLTHRCAPAPGGDIAQCLPLDRCRLDPEPPPASCGDTICSSSESCTSCPADCNECPPVTACGDGTCNGDETCSSCDDDCGACPPRCGDAACNGAETCTSCQQDCGACPRCGDAACNGAETCSSCQQDCGVCPPVCGDRTCDARESCESCAGDCGACPAPYSGPCDDDDDCAPSHSCKRQTVSGLFGGNYGYCAQTCTTDLDCSGRTGQRSCGTDRLCALRCNVLECALFNQDRCCPVGMECLDTGCSWLR